MRGDFCLLLEFPTQLSPAISAVHLREARQKTKTQANKSTIRCAIKWMNERSSLQVFLSPPINEFCLLH